MSTWIQIDFYPDYMDKITSFHLVDDILLNQLNEMEKDNSLFIENFYRVTKNNYKHLTNDNLNIIKLKDKINIVEQYLEYFGNNTDLLDLIKTYLNINDNDSNDYDILTSDDELTESFKINEYLKSKNENNESKANEILKINPNLKYKLEDIEF